MIRSMTGYGRGQAVVDGREIAVEIRSVNHRYFEWTGRMPRAYGYLDEKLKSLTQEAISRGKVDCSLLIQTVDGGSTEIQINHALAQSYTQALRALGQELNLRDDLSITALARFSDIFVVRRAPEDEEEVWAGVRQVAAQALEQFVEMRTAEGRRLREDLLGRLESIRALVAAVEEQSPRTVAAYRARLTAKLQEVLEQKTLEPQRILTEAAIVAERLAVDEETVRLRSHLTQFEEILAGSDAVGRKLDFLVQEMNREANTIGSKCQDLALSRVVVEIKSEIEKIREQIQNIE